MKRFALPFLALFFGAFLIYPLVGLLGGAFFLTDAQGHRLSRSSSFGCWSRTGSTASPSSTASRSRCSPPVFTALVSIPLAVLFTRYRFPGREWLRPALLAPLILPPFVGALGIKHIFARFGALNLLLAKLGIISLAHPIDWLGASGFTGIVILEVLHLFPIFFLSVSAALANIDPSLLDAAANLGASAWRRFLTITLPLARPGLFAGACIVFISAFTDLGTPLILNFSATVPTQIFNASVDANSEQIGYAFVVATLVLVMVFFLLVRRFGESAASVMPARASHAADERNALARWPVGAPPSPSAAFLFVADPAASSASSSAPSPSAGSSPSCPRNLHRNITPRSSPTASPPPASPTRSSTPASAPSSISASASSSRICSRATVFPGKSLLDALAMLPLALPGLVLAFGLLMSYNLHGCVGVDQPAHQPHFSPRHQLRAAPPALHRPRRLRRLPADQRRARGSVLQSRRGPLAHLPPHHAAAHRAEPDRRARS